MDIVFFIKKVISLFIDPVAFVLGLLGWGALFLLLARVFQNKEKARAVRIFRWCGRIWLVAAVLLLYLGSLGPISGAFTRSLEKTVTENIDETGEYRFEKEPKFLVVLAGGSLSVEGKPTLSRLTRHAMARVVGAVDLWKRYPDATFVVTGHPSETLAMQTIAIQLGVDAEKVVMEKESRDTKDHPVFLKPILGDAPFLLVTSAVHMPRSVGLFRGQELDPMLAPVDFQSWPESGLADPYSPYHIAPKAAHFYSTAMAIHEIVGLRWAKMRGQIVE